MSVCGWAGDCCLPTRPFLIHPIHPDQSTHSAFCVMVPSTPDAIDARSFANAVGVFTFLASVVLYIKSFRVLWGLRRM